MLRWHFRFYLTSWEKASVKYAPNKLLQTMNKYGQSKHLVGEKVFACVFFQQIVDK